MHFSKKTGIICLSIFIASICVIGLLLNMPAEEKADSVEDYRFIINQDGTAKIVGYLKDREEARIPSEFNGHPVKVIGRKAFAFKPSTASVQIPGTVRDIKSEAFMCSGIKEIRIPEGVLKIGSRAFWGCPELEKIYISSSVEKIGGTWGITDRMADRSVRLREIEVDPRNAVYASVDGVLYNKDVTELLEIPEGKDLESFQFPDSVVSIGEDAFCSDMKETSIEFVIPDQITTLKRGAFADCWELEKVTISKNVTEIANAAFMYCGKLSAVEITGKPKVIGDNAFCGCYTLSEINIPDSVTEIGETAFYDCVSLTNITIPRSVTKIGGAAIGYSDDCEARISGVTITGYKDTAAWRYAKVSLVAFRDIETGVVTRFDLAWPVPRGRVKALAGREREIRVECKEVEEASYRIAVKKDGASSWEEYSRLKPSAVIKGMESGNRYKVKVRAVREIDGKKYYGKWSKVKKVTVR